MKLNTVNRQKSNKYMATLCHLKTLRSCSFESSSCASSSMLENLPWLNCRMIHGSCFYPPLLNDIHNFPCNSKIVFFFLTDTQMQKIQYKISKK